MAVSSTLRIGELAGQVDVAQALRREARLRLGLGALICAALLAILLGGSWDAQWHTMIGRDTFLTPPHMMLYSGSSLAGLLCLGFVLLETFRYYRGATAVNDATTSRIFRVFHAPLGFVVAGFGMVIMVASAPLDDYWHQLYGLDVTAWSPFHVMPMIGMVMMGLGTMYIFASESGRLIDLDKAEGKVTRRYLGFSGPQLGMFGAFAFMLGTTATANIPSVLEFPTLVLGSFELLNYPLLAAAFTPLLLVALVRATGVVGAATLSGFALLGLRWLLDWFGMAGATFAVDHMGQTYRLHASFDSTLTAPFPVWLPLIGLLVDLVYLAARRGWLFGWAWSSVKVAMLAGAVTALSYGLLEQPWRRLVSDFPQIGSEGTSLLLITLPFAILIGAISGWVGSGLGVVLAATRD